MYCVRHCGTVSGHAAAAIATTGGVQVGRDRGCVQMGESPCNDKISNSSSSMTFTTNPWEPFLKHPSIEPTKEEQ